MQGGFWRVLPMGCFYLVFWILDTEKGMPHNEKRGWRSEGDGKEEVILHFVKS